MKKAAGTRAIRVMQAYSAAGEPSEEPEPERAEPTPEPVSAIAEIEGATDQASGWPKTASRGGQGFACKKKPKRAAVAKTKRKTAKTAKKKPEKKSIKAACNEARSNETDRDETDRSETDGG